MVAHENVRQSAREGRAHGTSVSLSVQGAIKVENIVFCCKFKQGFELIPGKVDELIILITERIESDLNCLVDGDVCIQTGDVEACKDYGVVEMGVL